MSDCKDLWAKNNVDEMVFSTVVDCHNRTSAHYAYKSGTPLKRYLLYKGDEQFGLV